MQNKKSNKRKKGFTLAEVLLTMTIIGIIAALTIPSLITSTSKSETEARLQKFYANMSQAVELAETEYDTDIISILESLDTSSERREFLEDYLKGTYESSTSSWAKFSFNDGTLMDISSNNFIISSSLLGTIKVVVVAFCPNASECSTLGVDKFNFYFSSRDGFVTNRASYMAPNSYTCDKQSTLVSLCKNGSNADKESSEIGACTQLIQCNGWKITDDYPLDI